MDWGSNHHISQKLVIYATLNNRANTLISDENDKKAEHEYIQTALKRCNHPEWALKERRKNPDTKDPPIGRVTIPYVKGLSEKINRIYQQHNIQAIHKPTTKLKNILCRTKDPLHHMDKPNAIYYSECKQHEATYVGERARPLKARAAEHRIITTKEANKSFSLIEDNPTPPTNTRTTRNTRNLPRIDYAAMHKGTDQHITLGNTQVSEHIATQDHNNKEVTITPLGYEANWRKRVFKEALAIKELKPNLNADEGKVYIPAIYQNIPPMFSAKGGPVARLHSGRKTTTTTESRDQETRHYATEEGSS